MIIFAHFLAYLFALSSHVKIPRIEINVPNRYVQHRVVHQHEFDHRLTNSARTKNFKDTNFVNQIVIEAYGYDK